MSKAKKIIGGLLEGTGELVKETAEKVAETVGPTKLVESAVGPKKSGSELGEYLESLSGNLSAEELEKKKREYEEQQKEEIEKSQKVIKEALPAHLKPPSSEKKPSVYEENIAEEEKKKAQEVETLKKKPKPLIVPAGQQKGILGGRKKRPKTADLEIGRDIKIG